MFAQRVRNYTKKPIDLEIRRSFDGHIIFRSELEAKNHDYQTVQYTATVKPGQRSDLLYEIVQQQGHNAKQNNVTIERSRRGTVRATDEISFRSNNRPHRSFRGRPRARTSTSPQCPAAIRSN